MGCAVLGATYEWRKAAQPDSYSDCNWPKAGTTATKTHLFGMENKMSLMFYNMFYCKFEPYSSRKQSL